MQIEIENLNKVYRGNIHALDNLTLTIPSGMFGLLGANGAGKTTLMRIMAGILRPTSGKVRIGEYDVTDAKSRHAIKQLLGYLPQEFGVYPDLSAREFLDYIGILKGLTDRSARHNRVAELLETVALTSVAERKLKTFSGGMKRRVGIAQALLNNPRLLIVDEPTAGLDPEERIRFRNLLSDLAENRTVLLSTHIVEDIAQTSQNIAIMKNGRVIFQDTIIQLIEQTRGKVWLISVPQGIKPQEHLMIVSTVHTGSAIQYRVVGNAANVPGAVPVDPTLEDSYLWFMGTASAEEEALLFRKG